MSKRSLVVDLATREIGKSDPTKYWREVLQSGPPFPPHWCGAFALWALREASLTDWYWQIGKGFLYRLPRTRTPEPGDIGYQDQPFQHHFLLTEVDTHTLTSVDGNQGTPGVQLRHRAVGSPKLAFYSIAPLLRDEDTQPAMPPPWRRTLRIGSTGPDVTRLQTALGCGADGVYGPRTAAAVMEFQRRNKLDADGIAGTLTQAALFDQK